jgi:hypothetical protein
MQGCAVLALLSGCESVKSQTASPADSSLEQPARTEAPSPTAASPWQRARVGDRVTYAFSAQQKPVGAQASQSRSGELRLEVVAVRQPWVWLKLSATHEGGRTPPHSRLSQELLLPMRAEATLPLEVPREGTESAEQATAAGRSWKALRYVNDQRLVDGPLAERVFSVEPGPLYLANGLLEAKNVLSGFGTGGEVRLRLVDVREGSESAPSTLSPAQPLGPGSWYDVRVEAEGAAPRVERTCMTAERGFVVWGAPRPAPAAGSEPCPDFRENVQVAPMENVLVDLVWQAAGESTWPPRPAAQGAGPTALPVQGKDVPVLVAEERTPMDGGGHQVMVESYAQSPWHPSLNGLSLDARFAPLASRTEQVDAKGQRTTPFRQQLMGWGQWVEATK